VQLLRKAERFESVSKSSRTQKYLESRLRAPSDQHGLGTAVVDGDKRERRSKESQYEEIAQGDDD